MTRPSAIGCLMLPASGAHTKVTVTSKFSKHYEALVVPFFTDYDEEWAERMPHADELRPTLLAMGATGRYGEVVRIPISQEDDSHFAVAVGLGSFHDCTAETVRRACGLMARSLTGVDTAFMVDFETLDPAAAAEGALLGSYKYFGFKNDVPAATQPVKRIKVLCRKKDKAACQRALVVAESVNFARDLVNTPSSHLYPETYAAALGVIAQDFDLGFTRWDEMKLKERGFGGILAVGSGSARKPQLVQLRYQPADTKKHVSLVGKGITFDTGGISIKPAASMENMISDMGGSAAVVATVVAAARLQLPVAVTATVALAENMPGGEAYRPGDVVIHYGEKTTEILNTDAEGRLVLADALAFASEEQPDVLIDVATLTGAQIVALGDRTSGVMGDAESAAQLAHIGREVDEPAWAMPLPEELAEAVKSPVADLRNATPKRHGGMLSAACFLREFVKPPIQWAHVDIAGPAFNTSTPHGFTPARGTGVPVRTLIEFLSSI